MGKRLFVDSEQLETQLERQEEDFMIHVCLFFSVRWKKTKQLRPYQTISLK